MSDKTPNIPPREETKVFTTFDSYQIENDYNPIDLTEKHILDVNAIFLTYYNSKTMSKDDLLQRFTICFNKWREEPPTIDINAKLQRLFLKRDTEKK